MINIPIQYKGEVIIRIKGKPVVKKHNSGTVHMFNLINRIFSRSLHDSEELGISLPSHIALIYNAGLDKSEIMNGEKNYVEHLKQYSLTITELPIVSRSIETVNNSIGEENIIVYKSLLTNSLLRSDKSDVTSSGYALLLDGTCSKILAVSDIELESLAPLYDDPLGESDVEWRMTFNNIE